MQQKEYRGPLLASGIVPALVAALYKDYEDPEFPHCWVIGALNEMASSGNDFKNAILFALYPLVARLTADPLYSDIEVNVLAVLAGDGSKDLQEVVVRSGEMRPLLEFVTRTANMDARLNALIAIDDFARSHSSIARQAVVDVGAMPVLLRLLTAQYDHAEYAARATLWGSSAVMAAAMWKHAVRRRLPLARWKR